MERIKIVPAEEKYIEDCARIAVRAWESIHESYKNCIGAQLHDELMSDWQEMKAQAVRALHAGNALVALLGDKTVGYVSYKVKGILGEITDNAVDPELQGRGIAGQLCSAAMDAMRAAGCSYAAVEPGLDEGHAPARRVFQKLGFEKNLPSIMYYQRLDPNMETFATSSETVQVIPCQEKHLDDCARITLIAWNIIHNNYVNCIGQKMHDELYAGWQESTVKAMKAAQLSGRGYVAIVDGQVAGYAAYRIDGKVGVVGRNAVDPAFRGRGIAKLMYGMLINRMVADGCPYARVHTGLDEGHTGARKAYGKVGFALNLQSIRYFREL